MSSIYRKEHIIAFLGDIVVLFLSLYVTLIIRYGDFPSAHTLENHLIPFSILFCASILINFIAGLYEKHTLLFKKNLSTTLFNVQFVNAIIAVAFFYFIPFFSIAPKIVLFVYLLMSLLFMLVWRIFLVPLFGSRKVQKALLLCKSKECQELKDEINNNSRYNLSFISDHVSDIAGAVKTQGISTIVIDTYDPSFSHIIPTLYPLMLSGVSLVDMSKMYEAIFDRVSISSIKQTWFIENMSSISPKPIYDLVKRLIDIFVSSVLAILSLIIYPFVISAIKIEDGGAVFSYQTRVGKYNKVINIIKFRTMTVANDHGKWGAVENKVTRVGAFLRKTRIDELPQLWNVVRGDISLIGPRPEFPEPVQKYTEEIPYYNIRHTIKPGLSGWAQIYGEHPHHGVDIEKTSNKLSYDLYYIKNRSFLTDLKISLRTIKVLMSFVGR